MPDPDRTLVAETHFGDDATVISSDRTGLPREIGRYMIDSVLGEGAMGVVYKGFDPSIKRHVAIKTIRKEHLAEDESGEYLERFKREAQAAGRFIHPNVVAVFEFGEHEGTPYLALEYVAGRELKALLVEGNLNLEDIRRLFVQVLAGLGVAHSAGVVHRDVKPQNIFVLPDGLAKVGDFGIARLDTTSLTKTGSSLGTPSYMSPEQFIGTAVDNRSDLYAAGAILYEMIAGVKAFSGTSITEVMYAVLEKDPPDLSELKDNVPVAIAQVVKKALAKKPDDRFQSAEEFSAALEAAYARQGLAMQTGKSSMFRSTDALTNQVLPTLHVSIRKHHDHVLPLIARRIRGRVGSKGLALIQDAARRSLDYDSLVALVGVIETDSEQRGAVFTLADQLSKGPVGKDDEARLDACLGLLVQSSANNTKEL